MQTPTKCIELINNLLLSRWSFVVNHGTDTGGSPYINVEAARDNQKLYITWHTRETGTYRLFSCLHNARTVTLTKAMEAITA